MGTPSDWSKWHTDWWDWYRPGCISSREPLVKYTMNISLNFTQFLLEPSLLFMFSKKSEQRSLVTEITRYEPIFCGLVFFSRESRVNRTWYNPPTNCQKTTSFQCRPSLKLNLERTLMNLIEWSNFPLLGESRKTGQIGKRHLLLVFFVQRYIYSFPSHLGHFIQGQEFFYFNFCCCWFF